jgi:hypothetical protein
MRRFRSDAGLICRIATLRRRDHDPLRCTARRDRPVKDNRLERRGLLLLFFS